MRQVRLPGPAVLVMAGLWSGPAFAKADVIDRASQFLDRLSQSEYYGGLGILLIGLAVFSFKREWSIVLTTVATIAGVISLMAAIVIWFLGGEVKKGDLAIWDRRHHKVTAGSACKATSDCVHGALCVRLRNANRCYYPCGADETCLAPMSCLTASGGEHVCSQ